MVYWRWILLPFVCPYLACLSVGWWILWWRNFITSFIILPLVPTCCPQSTSPYRWACPLGNLPVLLLPTPHPPLPFLLFILPSSSVPCNSFPFWSGQGEEKEEAWNGRLLCLWEQLLPVLVLPPEPAVLLLHSDGGRGGQSAPHTVAGGGKNTIQKFLPSEPLDCGIWVSFHVRVQPPSVSSRGSCSF